MNYTYTPSITDLEDFLLEEQIKKNREATKQAEKDLARFEEIENASYESLLSPVDTPEEARAIKRYYARRRGLRGFINHVLNRV